MVQMAKGIHKMNIITVLLVMRAASVMYVIIDFEYIVQVTMALHFGACVISILKDFIIIGENVLDVFGMFLETHIVDFPNGGENTIIVKILTFLPLFYE